MHGKVERESGNFLTKNCAPDSFLPLYAPLRVRRLQNCGGRSQFATSPPQRLYVCQAVTPELENGRVCSISCFAYLNGAKGKAKAEIVVAVGRVVVVAVC